MVTFFSCVFFSTKPRDWLGRSSPKWPICVGWDRLSINQSINHWHFCVKFC